MSRLIALLAIAAALACCGGGGTGSGPSSSLAIGPPLPRPARAGWPYREPIQVSGGAGSLSLQLLEDALPAGLAFRADTWEILGLPESPGLGHVRLRAFDASAPERAVERTLYVQVGAPWPDADPMRGPYSVLFIHHSVGWNLMYRSGTQGLAATLFDHGYLPFSLTYGQGLVDGHVIGDHTDVPDWPVTFNTPSYFDTIATWTRPPVALPSGHHDVILFKSCYPNSDLPDAARVEEFKAHYLALLPTFAAHPEMLFVVLTTPPLHPLATRPDRAARARELALWLTIDYASRLSNLAAFDLFDLLANPPSHPSEPNMLREAYRVPGGDSHPTAASDPVVAGALLRFLNAALRAWGREP